MSLVLSSAVRMLFPPDADQLQGANAPALWLKQAGGSAGNPQGLILGVVAIVVVAIIGVWIADLWVTLLLVVLVVAYQLSTPVHKYSLVFCGPTLGSYSQFLRASLRGLGE